MTSKSLLSWDDYTEDENPAVAKAAKAVQQLDTAPVLKEVAVQEAKYQQTKAVTFSPVTASSEAILKRAQEAIHLADDQLTYGGRLNVEDKRLLNSATDLNQLVPFKYEWAWQGYLESCGKHWMPAEIPLEKDLAFLYETSNPERTPDERPKYITGTNERKVLANLIGNHMRMRHAVPTMTWLNVYRLMENPECRQYLLRQVFEISVADHAMSNLEEILSLLTFKVGDMSMASHLHLLEDSYKERHNLLLQYLPLTTGTTGTTEGIENTRAFVLELIVLYGIVGWSMQVIPLYQAVKLDFVTGKFNGVAETSMRVLGDLLHHQQLFKLILDTALEENPEIIDNDFRQAVAERLRKLLTIEEDILSLLSVDEDDYKELTWLMKVKNVEILTAIGVHPVGNLPYPTPYMTSFMARLDSMKINLHGGGASVTGSGGGALGW